MILQELKEDVRVEERRESLDLKHLAVSDGRHINY